MFSEEYKEWVKQSKLPPLTNNQHKFAEFLLHEDNIEMIKTIGDMESIFTSIRKHLKNNQLCQKKK